MSAGLRSLGDLSLHQRSCRTRNQSASLHEEGLGNLYSINKDNLGQHKPRKDPEQTLRIYWNLRP